MSDKQVDTDSTLESGEGVLTFRWKRKKYFDSPERDIQINTTSTTQPDQSVIVPEEVNPEIPPKVRRVQPPSDLPLSSNIGKATVFRKPAPKPAKHVTESGRIDWDYIHDPLELEETIRWIPADTTEPPPSLEQCLARKIGSRYTDYELSTPFACRKTMNQLMDAKTNLHAKDFQLRIEARMKSNPFETIRSGIFMNRAGMKMANIDTILGFELTHPKTQEGGAMVQNHELLYFADICAGPGGFSEYVLWRKKWEAKGFGFTLRAEENDFNLQRFIAGPHECLEIYYGQEGDGNILNPVNVKSFVDLVLRTTGGSGVHFVMADGGFEVDGLEEKQELLSKSLVLSQFLVALAIVRPGGHFICKMFDVFTPFSVGLIYIMYRCFSLVAVHKPNTSRPANSERYLICKWKKEDTEFPRAYLNSNHELLWDYTQNATKDILELVDMDVLTHKDGPFFQYILHSNNSLAKQQIKNIEKLDAFCRCPQLLETRQDSVRKACLEMWKIPLERPILDEPEFPATRFDRFVGSYPKGFLAGVEKELTSGMLEESFKSLYDWRFVVVEGIGNGRNRAFYFGMGGSRVYRLQNHVWDWVGVKFELCKDTLVYGEVVHLGCNENTKPKVVFEIIDGLILGGIDIRHLHFNLRYELCRKFAKSMDKPSRPDLVPVQMKPLMRMENLQEVLGKMVKREVKSKKTESGFETKLVYEGSHHYEFYPAGILFLRITQEPWMMALSRSANRKYWFNSETNASVFDIPEGAIADFLCTLRNRLIWWWDKDTLDEDTPISTTSSEHQLKIPKVNRLSRKWMENYLESRFGIANPPISG